VRPIAGHRRQAEQMRIAVTLSDEPADIFVPLRRKERQP
jgi:hypothetical protein